MKSKHLYKIILSCLIVAVCLFCANARSQQIGDKQNSEYLGRNDPFGQLVGTSKPVPEHVVTVPVGTPKEIPDLFIRTVMLKFLDAKSLEQAIGNISSEYGSISINEKNNSLIICDTRETLDKILREIEAADIKTETPALFVRTVMLKFLDAKSIENLIGNMSSEYGSISINEKNNSLIICDTKETLERILKEIETADKTPQQIMIEVVILDVQLDDDTEIGINWDILSDNRYDIGYRQNFTTSRIGSTVEDETTIGDATAFNSTGLGGSFSVISGTIRNVLHLIQQKRDVEILASPRVMLLSGESASIEAVEELPYTEIMDAAAGGAAALTTTRFKNVGVQLKVEATLTDGNDIFLKVETEQNVATGESNTEVPIIDTRKADTSLLLNDGQVVVLGGLRRQEKTREIDQIPILGDIPIIGNLFKNTTIVIKNSELIVFLSPHVYKGEPVPEDAMQKYRQITEKPVLELPDDIVSAGNIEQLRQKRAEHEQYERNVTKMLLLDKIKILRQRKDKEATKELLSALAELDEIINQELNETIASSEKVLAGGSQSLGNKP